MMTVQELCLLALWLVAGPSYAFTTPPSFLASRGTIVESTPQAGLLWATEEYLDDMASGSASDDNGDSTDEASEPSEYLSDLAVNEEEDTSPSDIEDITATISTDTTKNDDRSRIPANEKDAMTVLLQIAASTGRGEFASDKQKDSAAQLVAQLEAKNPTPEPTNDPSIYGSWELVYSSTQLFRSSPFFMAGRAVCSTPDEAKQYDWFCDMHRKALAISTIKQVRQIISPTRMVSEFEVQVGAIPFLSDFTPFQYAGGIPVTVDGSIVSSADITPTASGNGWELYMDTVEIKGSNIPGLRQILDNGLKLGSRQLGNFLENNLSGYTNPRPVFETTYLSDTMRISRDQDGKIFVYAKMWESTEPTDYGSIDADLGVLKLLEGFNDSITKFYL